MLLVMGIMCSNPDKKDDAIDGALLRAWDKMKQEQGAMAASARGMPQDMVWVPHSATVMANNEVRTQVCCWNPPA